RSRRNRNDYRGNVTRPPYGSDYPKTRCRERLESALLVGHDWGGSIAWATAMNHPEVVDRLAILNVAHPRRLSEGLKNPNQLRKSWYFFFFAVPGLPEEVVHSRDWHFFRHFLQDANPPYTPQEIERYVEAWSQPGAATGMINYYRASVRQSQKEAAAKLRPISAPTLVIWGERDSYLGSKLAEPDRSDVPNLDRVERLPDASHWVHHDEAERVNQLLIDFFAAPAAWALKLASAFGNVTRANGRLLSRSR